MIISENITINGHEFIRTYSDNNKMIERDNVQYFEAIDPVGFDRVYIETDIDIDDDYNTTFDSDGNPIIG
jgi:hypothetical protein